jgi:hypothetical protein
MVVNSSLGLRLSFQLLRSANPRYGPLFAPPVFSFSGGDCVGHVAIDDFAFIFHLGRDLDKSISRPRLTTLESLRVKLPVLKLNADSRMVTPPVSGESLFANIDFLRMEPKPFRLHETEGANNHIKQRDAFFFARNPIGVTYNQLAAMLTSVIHDFLHWQARCHIGLIY